jgi:Gpi18-like mannosyltransferase
VGALVVSTIAGLASIPLLLRVAERYLPSGQAFKCMFVYFLFPPVFVFSGVSYSDSLFLLLSLLTWNCHVEAKNLRATLVAGLCTLVRSYGILIAVPLAYDFLRRREFRKLGYLIIPVSVLALWLAYAYSMTGSLAVFSARALFVSQNVLILRNGLIEFLHGRLNSLQVLLYFMWRYLPIAVAALFAILLVAFSCVKVWRMDRALCLYTCVSLLVIAYFGFFPSFGSFPRYLAFIFPIALAFDTKRNLLFYAALITFLVLSFVAWWAFLTDGFF